MARSLGGPIKVEVLALTLAKSDNGVLGVGSVCSDFTLSFKGDPEAFRQGECTSVKLGGVLLLLGGVEKSDVRRCCSFQLLPSC
jgi:hypothetical protein